jgi:hypothetical protein
MDSSVTLVPVPTVWHALRLVALASSANADASLGSFLDFIFVYLFNSDTLFHDGVVALVKDVSAKGGDSGGDDKEEGRKVDHADFFMFDLLTQM